MLLVKDLITQHLDDTQPFGYEWKQIYAKLLEELEKQGDRVSKQTMQRRLATPIDSIRTLPYCFFDAVQATMQLNLLQAAKMAEKEAVI